MTKHNPMRFFASNKSGFFISHDITRELVSFLSVISEYQPKLIDAVGAAGLVTEEQEAEICDTIREVYELRERLFSAMSGDLASRIEEMMETYRDVTHEVKAQALHQALGGLVGRR